MSFGKLISTIVDVIEFRLFRWTPTLAVIFGVLMILLACIVYRQKWSRIKKIVALCFGTYVFEVLLLTLLSRSVMLYVPAVSFKPFLLNDSLETGRKLRLAVEFVFNSFMFLPLGLIVPFFIKAERKYLITILIGISASLIIETFQAILRIGTFQTDDILANTTGVIIGVLLSMLIQKRINKKKDKSNQ